MRYFDNTRVSTAKNCLRQYYLRHKRDWVSDGRSPALTFGLSWHEAMDVVWGAAHSDLSDSQILSAGMDRFLVKWTEEGFPHWDTISPEQEDDLAPRTPGIAAEMLHQYIQKRRPMIRNNYEIVAIEQPFAVPIFPDRDDIFYIGRFDKVIKDRSGRIYVIEHKTTTSYKKGGPFRTDYLESWSPNSQIDGYLYAAHMLYGDAVKEVWVDAALVHKQVHDGFKFIPVNRNIAMLDQWLYETRWWINTIIEEDNQYAGHNDLEVLTFLPHYPKNTGACSHYSGCSYRDVCKMINNPETHSEAPLGYREDHWSPFEILELEKIGMPPEEY